MDAEPNYPWVVAMGAARRRLTRLQAAVAVAGAVVLGAVAALAAVASPAPASTPGASPASSSVDVFGQSTQPGPDNQPPGAIDPGNPSGANLGQGPPSIVSAPS